MKIQETIERACCEDRDLVPYNGVVSNAQQISALRPRFCCHCGQIWVSDEQGVLTGEHKRGRIVPDLSRIEKPRETDGST